MDARPAPPQTKPAGDTVADGDALLLAASQAIRGEADFVRAITDLESHAARRRLAEIVAAWAARPSGDCCANCAADLRDARRQAVAHSRRLGKSGAWFKCPRCHSTEQSQLPGAPAPDDIQRLKAALLAARFLAWDGFAPRCGGGERTATAVHRVGARHTTRRAASALERVI